MKPSRWRIIDTEVVYRTPIFDLHRRRSGHPRRGAHDFFFLDAPNWVNIIPVTRTGDVVMVKQFRHGIRGFTLEIPGGMIDPEDKSPKHAARREMVEETGYDSGRIAFIGRVHPNPAIEGNFCYTFFARDARPVGKPQLDGNEETAVVLVPLRTIPKLIASEKITHALVIAAFSFFHLYNPPRP
ncbi:MAG TPA: NUDIX hydrolase [Candidatus Binataceae bacterium]|nr:NUDIX hydrolase [Candidatus Binataceae bacterium]